MILFQRSIAVRAGKYSQALEFSKKIVTFFQDKYNIKMKIYSQWMGDRPVGTYFFVAKFEKIANYEEFAGKLGTDDEYSKIMEAVPGIFKSGTTIDNIMVQEI